MLTNFKAFLTGEKIRKFAQFGFGKLISSGLDFLIPLIVAAVLTKEGFSSFSLYKMVFFLLFGFFVAPFATPFIIEGNKSIKKNGHLREAFTSTLLGVTAMSILVILCSFILKAHLANFAEISDIYTFFFSFLVAFIGYVLWQSISTSFLAIDNKSLYTKSQVSYSLLLFAIVMAMSFTNSLTVEKVFYSYGIVGIIITIAMIPRIDFSLFFPLQLSSKSLRAIGHFSSWLVLGQSSMFLLTWGDNFFLKIYTNLEEIAVYNFSYAFIKVFAILSILITSFYTPSLSKLRLDRITLKEYFGEAYKIGSLIVIGSMFFLMVLAPIFISIFYSDYSDAFVVIRILALSTPAVVIGAYLAPIFNVSKKYQFTQIILIVQVLANLGLDYILIQKIGFIGAAVATTIAYYILAFSLIAGYRAMRSGIVHSES